MFVDDMIRLNGRHRPNDEGLVMSGQRLTYSELEARVEQVAAALHGADVRHGDRVAVLGKNSLEYFLLYFASARIGAILVPLNFWHREREHAYAIADSAPSLIFVESELRDALGVSPAGGRQVTLPVNDPEGGASWDAFVDGAGSSGTRVDERQPDDAHMILYTSGTTGRPKGAVLSHRRTIDDALAMGSALGIRNDDVFVNYFPPFHVGNWDHMKLFLMAGAKVILMRQFEAGEVLQIVEREAVTVVLGVPTMLHDLLEHPTSPSTDLGSVRLLYYGAYDPSGVMGRIADRLDVRSGRVEMAHTYGLTECGPFVTLCRPSELLDHWGSIGRPVPGVEVALLDDEGREVGIDEAGEICMRGPRLTSYWNRPEETAAAIVDGWFHTGDIATVDADGFYRIVDRKKDMIRSGGQNVYSKEVEDRLQEHQAVAAAAVIGVPDDRYEERVCAVVVLRESYKPTDELADDLRRFVRDDMAGYNTPKEIWFEDDLPRNAVGKTQKHLLRERFGSLFSVEGHARPVP